MDDKGIGGERKLERKGSGSVMLGALAEQGDDGDDVSLGEV